MPLIDNFDIFPKMSQIFPLFIILIAGLVFSQAFQRFHVPWTVALIAGGVAIGPFGLNIVSPDPTLEFLKYLGLVFLMFMAGMETRLSGFREVWKESSLIGAITGFIPFIVGIMIGIYFGYDTSTVALLGIIFVSSSIAIAIPALESKGLLHSHIGKTITSSIVIQDIASLLLLAVLLQYVAPGILPLPLFVTFFAFALLIATLIKWGIPRLRLIFEKYEGRFDPFEQETRVIFAILVGTVIVFEFLGLHAIVGAFFAGLILSEIIKEKEIKEKLHVMAYGLFIPAFFVILGIDTNIGVFSDIHSIIPLFITILLGSVIAKFAGGWISAKISGFTSQQSTLVGGSCIPKLSTALAIVAVGQQHNIITEELATTLIMLSIVTVFISPLLVGRATKKVKENYLVVEKEN